MRLPRSISGKESTQALGRVGYKVTRQIGSHIHMTCTSPTQHHVTIPNHPALRIGTLSAMLSDVATHLK